MVSLSRLSEGLDAEVSVKLEYLNPGGSVKDRIGVAMIDAAERDGLRAVGTDRSGSVACPRERVEIPIQHSAAAKGAAVPALLEACGAPGAEVVACGDHLNDLSLFAAATRSVAPANAHPEVLEVATEVVGSNDEDGIVRFLLDSHLRSAL